MNNEGKMWVLLTFCICCVAGELSVVDMTHIVSNESMLWAGSLKYNFTILNRGRSPDGSWFETNAFQTEEHIGTHLDAPGHFKEGSWRTHQIPMKNLIGPGVIIDVKDKVKSNQDYRVLRSDVETWEIKYGRVPKNAIVLMNSGWDKRFPNKTAVFNTIDPHNSSTYHFPGWHEEAVRMLANERQVNIVGVDTPSTDYGQSTRFPVHIILGSKQISGAENVANLDKVPVKGAMIFVSVINLYDGSGGPARVFATYDDAISNAASSVSFKVTVVFFLRCFMYMVA